MQMECFLIPEHKKEKDQHFADHNINQLHLKGIQINIFAQQPHRKY